MKTMLKTFQGVLSTDYPECSETQKKTEEVVDGGEEEQGTSSKLALLKITLHFLRRIKQEKLADSLQSSEFLCRFNMIEQENVKIFKLLKT